MKFGTKLRLSGTMGLMLCASAAWAQNNVTIYGAVDASMQRAKVGDTSVSRMDSSTVMPSIIGFKGNEDLGGGMSAIFKLESGLNTDNGSLAGSALFNRESWVGLQGPLGQIQAGVTYSPLFITYCTYSLGGLNNFGWGNATNNFFFVPSARLSNSVRYVSPQMAGLTVSAVGAFGTEGEAPRGMGDTFALGFNYKLEKFSVDLDFQRQKYATTATVTSATPVHQGSYYLLAASYDFGFVKPAFIYQKHRSDVDAPASISSSYATPNNHFYELSATIPRIGAGTLMLSYGQYTRESDRAGNATSYGIRYDYPLSKRTGLYVGAAQMRNGNLASFSVDNAGGPGVPTTPGADVKTFVMGMLTTF